MKKTGSEYLNDARELALKDFAARWLNAMRELCVPEGTGIGWNLEADKDTVYKYGERILSKYGNYAVPDIWEALDRVVLAQMRLNAEKQKFPVWNFGILEYNMTEKMRAFKTVAQLLPPPPEPPEIQAEREASFRKYNNPSMEVAVQTGRELLVEVSKGNRIALIGPHLSDTLAALRSLVTEPEMRQIETQYIEGENRDIQIREQMIRRAINNFETKKETT